jgi:hypothetical protein
MIFTAKQSPYRDKEKDALIGARRGRKLPKKIRDKLPVSFVGCSKEIKEMMSLSERSRVHSKFKHGNRINPQDIRRSEQCKQFKLTTLKAN